MVTNVIHLLISAILTSHAPVINGFRLTGMWLLDSLPVSDLFCLYFTYYGVYKCCADMHKYSISAVHWMTKQLWYSHLPVQVCSCITLGKTVVIEWCKVQFKLLESQYDWSHVLYLTGDLFNSINWVFPVCQQRFHTGLPLFSQI